MAAPFSLKELEDDPRLFLYTSLTAGSSHIITATSRMETILKANRIPFQAIDTATDEKARKLWQRRAGQRKLPGLVKEGFVIGDLEQVEEWNEFGELKEAIGPVPANNAAPPGGQVGINIAPPSLPVIPTATQGTATIRAAPENKAPQPGFDKSKAIRLPGAEEIAARNKEKAAAVSKPTSTLEAINPETLTSSPADKKESIEKAKEAAAAQESKAESTEPSTAAEDKTEKEEEESTAESAAEKELNKVQNESSVTVAEDEAQESTPEAIKDKSKEPHIKFKDDKKEDESTTISATEAADKELNKVQNETPATAEAEPVKAREPQVKFKDNLAKPDSKSSDESAKPEAETEQAAKGVSDLKVSEEKTQEQDPKDAEDAAKSVED